MKQENSEQLEQALFYIHDLFENALCDFFLMGPTAEAVTKNEWLHGEKVWLGIREKDLSNETIDILKLADPSIDVTDKKIIMIYEGIPIEIRRVRKHYRFLDYLDSSDYPQDYPYGSFLIPNPFDAFMRAWRFIH